MQLSSILFVSLFIIPYHGWMGNGIQRCSLGQQSRKGNSYTFETAGKAVVTYYLKIPVK